MPIISKEKIESLKVEYENLHKSLINENIFNSQMGGPMDSFKETASFQAVKSAKESKLSELRVLINTAQILPETVKGKVIILGKWFKIKNNHGTTRYRLVDPAEADPNANLLSFESPLGKQVIGKKDGDKFELNGFENIIEEVE